MPFKEIDQRLLALEYYERGECIRGATSPEVDGKIGRRAVALVYAMCESGVAGRRVTLDEVESLAVNAYQHEIDESLGRGVP